MRKNPPFGLILGVPANVNTKYVYGSGVGALNTSVRRYLKKRASFVCCSSNVTTTPLLPTTYTVSYNGNGGSGTLTDFSSPYTVGSTITVLGNTFSRYGYTFAGWSTNSSGTGSDYNGGDAFIINANTILYAQWIPIPPPPQISYTLTYNGNGGVGSEPALTTEYSGGTSVTILSNSGSPVLSKSGYGFAGWNTAADGTGINYVGGDPFTINANTILYANWIIGGVRLIYNGNGNTGGTPPSSSGTFYTVFSSVDVVGNTGLFTNGSLVFGGWNTATNGSGTSYPTGSEYTMPGANPFQVPPLLSGVYLYAQWIPAGGPYTLTYDAGTGGSGPAPTPISYSAGSVANIDTNTAFSNNTSPVFNGWNTLANGTGTSYPAGSKITMTANTTLYAQWGSSPAVTVTYDANGATGGSVPAAPTTYPTGVQVPILGQGSLTKPGYAFLGWNSSSTGAGSVYAPGYTFTSKTVTLYAQWAPGSTVKNCGGGTGSNTYIFYNYPFAQIVRGIDTSVTPNKDTVTIYTTCIMGSTSSNIGSGAAPEGLISITSKMVITSATITINTNTTYAIDALNNNYAYTITNGSGVTYWPTGATISSVTFPFAPPLPVNSAAGAPTYSVSTRNCVNGCGLSGTGSGSGSTFTSFNFFNQGVTLNYSNGTNTIFVSSPNNSVHTINSGSNWIQTPKSLYPYNYNSLTPRSSAALTTITIIPSTASEYVYPQMPDYTVEYNGNGATGGSIPVPVYMFPYTATTSVTISGVGSLVKSGSTFSKWNTQANGLGTDYFPGNLYSLSASIILYAIWV